MIKLFLLLLAVNFATSSKEFSLIDRVNKTNGDVNKLDELYLNFFESHMPNKVNPVKYNNKDRIVYLVTFSNELETMEILLNSIDGLVSCLVVVESVYTNKGQLRKKLLFSSIMSRNPNLTYRVIYLPVLEKINLTSIWDIEKRNMEIGLNYIYKHFDENDYVFVSHADEFPTISSFDGVNLVDNLYLSNTTFYYGSINSVQKNLNYWYPALVRISFLNDYKIRSPQNLHHFSCDSCVKLKNVIHLTSWPNVIYESRKMLSCTECKSGLDQWRDRLNELLMKLSSSIEYKTYSIIMNRANNVTGGVLNHYLEKNRNIYGYFFCDKFSVIKLYS